MAHLAVPVLLLLAVIGFVGGVGITTLGPGGVLVTIGLFALTALPPATVAGTAIVVHIATGLLGSAAFVRSGELREPVTRRSARILGAAALVGAPVGVSINAVVSGRLFGVLLGVFLALVAALVLVRERRSDRQLEPVHPRHRALVLAGLGFGVAVASGMFGVGGPLLAVPVLIAIGVPMLPALAAAQAQSVVVAIVGTAGYLLHGDVDGGLALLVGLPELAGVVVGWQIARRVPTRALRYALVVVLCALAPYVAFRP